MNSPSDTFNAAVARLQQAKAAAMTKTSAPQQQVYSEREKLSSIKRRNEDLIARGASLQLVGERGIEKIAFARVPTNSFSLDGFCSRDVLQKMSSHGPTLTHEGYDPYVVAESMDVISPDDALAVFQKTAARYGVDPLTYAAEMDLGHPTFVTTLRSYALTKVSSDDIAKAKDAVQAIVKAKGELPSAVDISQAANVSPLAANVAIHETAELIAAVGGEVASADVPMVPDAMGGPEMMGAGPVPPAPLPPQDPNMMGPPPMDPNMMGAPPMDPQDPNMMGPPPQDPNMMPPQGMQAQADWDDEALERMIMKLASDMAVSDPTDIPQRTTAPLGGAPLNAVGGETPTSTRKRNLGIFQGAEKGPSLGIDNVHPDDESGTLELDSSHLLSGKKETSVDNAPSKVASVDWAHQIDMIFKGSEEDSDDSDDSDDVEVAVDADDDTSGESDGDTDEEITSWIKDYLRDNSEYPTADAVTSRFSVSDDHAESLIAKAVEED